MFVLLTVQAFIAAGRDVDDAELSYRMSRALVAAGESDAALEMLESLPARYFVIDAGLNWDPGHLYWYRTRRSVTS